MVGTKIKKYHAHLLKLNCAVYKTKYAQIVNLSLIFRSRTLASLNEYCGGRGYEISPGGSTGECTIDKYARSPLRCRAVVVSCPPLMQACEPSIVSSTGRKVLCLTRPGASTNVARVRVHFEI